MSRGAGTFPDIRRVDMIPAPGRGRDDHHRRAHFRVIRMKPLPVHRTDRQAKDRVGIPIKVALIVQSTSVPSCKYEDASFAPSSPLDPIDHGLQDQTFRSVHGFPIVRWTPGTGIDVVLLELVVERRGLVGIRDRSREDPDPRDLGTVSDAYSADVVGDRGYFSGTTGPVLVIGETRAGQGIVVVEIVGTFCKLSGDRSDAQSIGAFTPCTAVRGDDTLCQYSQSFQPDRRYPYPAHRR